MKTDEIDALYAAFAERAAMLARVEAGIKEAEGWVNSATGEIAEKWDARLRFLKGTRHDLKESVDTALKTFAAAADRQLVDETIILLLADNALTPKAAWDKVTAKYPGIGTLPPTTLEKFQALS